ncbi:MAG: hypothetical protein BWX88_04428 [Planctomycetes bacterium ADurb.Bin126]|nr:MAG: hypothetical protein BWX88_04428 [Planctomycetes bacterium ADurb.Bin126]HOD82859.1 hypothetical protein [Phycisphaerae bacterium]
MDDAGVNAVRQDLIKKIHHAFEGVARGKGITLHQARIIDDAIWSGAGPEEEAFARGKDSDRKWQEIPRQVIEELGEECAFLDAEGFRYYLPALMIWTLSYGKGSDNVAGDYLIYDLARNERIAGLDCLSGEQAGSVAEFLKYVADHPDERWADAVAARLALENYWDKFL